MVINTNDYTIYDFTSAEKSGQWYIVNDGVMGGISQSGMVLNEDGTATFKGIVRLENNGGFASVRSRLELPQESYYKGVVVRVKGDGNIYSLRFRTSNSFDGYAYQAKIKTVKDEWKEFKVPFSDFKATFRGYTLKGKPALESQNIAQMGILIADKQSGDFEIIMDWIKFYN